MNKQHIEKICKIGKGSETCRYLTISPDGWDCEKNSPLKTTIDNNVKAMIAKSDNCKGKTTEFLNIK